MAPARAPSCGKSAGPRSSRLRRFRHLLVGLKQGVNRKPCNRDEQQRNDQHAKRHVVPCNVARHAVVGAAEEAEVRRRIWDEG